VGSATPPTTKVGITAKGGFQAEFHFFLTGLDIREKAEMVERQTIESMGQYRKEFHTLKFTSQGQCLPIPKTRTRRLWIYVSLPKLATLIWCLLENTKELLPIRLLLQNGALRTAFKVIREQLLRRTCDKVLESHILSKQALF
jgi:hypothetical protein